MLSKDFVCGRNRLHCAVPVELDHIKQVGLCALHFVFCLNIILTIDVINMCWVFLVSFVFIHSTSAFTGFLL